MKKYIIAAGVALLGLSSVNAQDINFGIKAGVNLANFSGDDVENNAMKIGAYAGAYANLGLTEKIFFQPELLFSMQGVDADEGDGSTKLNYINIPLMFQYGLTEEIRLELGPQVGMLLSADLDNGEQEVDFKDEMSSIDFGMNVGASYNMDNGLSVSVRYNMGLTEVMDSEIFESDAKNSVISIGVGYAL